MALSLNGAAVSSKIWLLFSFCGRGIAGSINRLCKNLVQDASVSEGLLFMPTDFPPAIVVDAGCDGDGEGDDATGPSCDCISGARPDVRPVTIQWTGHEGLNPLR
jgi:hypothetical protein